MLQLIASLLLIGIKLISGVENAGGPTALTYSLLEEQPTGTELGDLLADISLTDGLSSSLSKQIYFTVLPGKYK